MGDPFQQKKRQGIARRSLIAAAMSAPLWIPGKARAVFLAQNVARPSYACRLMILGQSQSHLLTYTAAGTGLRNGIITNALGSGSGAVSPTVSAVEMINYASDGSCSCLQNVNGAGSYWVDLNGGSPIGSALLTAAVSDVTARVALSTAPTAFLLEQGQADVAACAGSIGGLTAAQARTNYVNAWTFIISQLQTALGGAGPVPVYIMFTGRQAPPVDSGLVSGFDSVRQAQFSLLGSVSHMVKVPDDYDLALFGGVHADRNWQNAYGTRFAAAIIKNQYGATAFQGPSIGSISLLAGPIVRVNLSSESGDAINFPTTPLGPWGFKFYDGSTPLVSTFAGYSSGNPTWSLNTTPGSLKMKFIDDSGANFDPSRLLTGSVSGFPLQVKQI